MRVAAYIGLGIAACFAVLVVDGGLYLQPSFKFGPFIPTGWSIWTAAPFVLLAGLMTFGPATWNDEVLTVAAIAMSFAGIVLYAIAASESSDAQAGMGVALLPLVMFIANGVAVFAAALKGPSHEV